MDEVFEEDILALLDNDNEESVTYTDIYHVIPSKETQQEGEIIARLMNRTIKNEFDVFKHIEQKIDLSKHWLYCRGVTESNPSTYRVYKIKIIDCENVPLHGAHCIEVYGSKPAWVTSLTAFRRDVLQFTDSVSFERSTFYIGPGSKLVRLKLIRNIVYINQPEKVNFTELTKKGIEQIERLKYQITQVYYRDMGLKPNITISY
jgi:hypothetical protein